MVPIETDRLLIRNFTPADGGDLYEIVTTYQASPYAAYDHKWPESEAEIRGVAEWFAGGDSYMAVSVRDTGKVIGFVCLNEEEGEAGRQLNLGYIFNSRYSGRGYATEACRAALRRAFEALGAVAVVTGTAAANEPSVRLLTRLGFRRTGGGTGSFQNDTDGKPIVFEGYSVALTREEWAAATA